jgi:hypothetical protein
MLSRLQRLLLCPCSRSPHIICLNLTISCTVITLQNLVYTAFNLLVQLQNLTVDYHFLWDLNPSQIFSSLGAYTPVFLMYFPLKPTTEIWNANLGLFIHATLSTFYFHQVTEWNIILFYNHQPVYHIPRIINNF